MVKKSTSTVIFIIDLLIMYTCFFGVYTLIRGFNHISLGTVMFLAYIGLAWFIIAVNSSVTNVNIESKTIRVIKDTLIGYSVLSASVIGPVAVFGEFAPNNKLILWPMFFAVGLSLLLRLFTLITIKHFVKQGYQQKDVLIIGGGRVAEAVVKQITSSPELGYRLHGFLSDDLRKPLPRRFYLGKLDRFKEVVRSGAVNEVIIALPLKLEETIIEMVEKCEYEGIRVRIVPDFFRIIRNRAVLENIADIPLIGIRTEPLSFLRNRFIKRVFDIVFSLLVMVLLSPVYLLLAILIKLTSPGTAFFRQKRIGANNVEFEIYKFRSMTIQKEKMSDTIWTTPNDSRVTFIGRAMRKANLDELPQFWNVFIGNMSVVGPRPEREHFVEKFKKKIHFYKVRHLVKSGITGLAQVNGWRGDTSIEERVKHDIYYMENWTFGLDIKIIWLTLFGRKTQKNSISANRDSGALGTSINK